MKNGKPLFSSENFDRSGSQRSSLTAPGLDGLARSSAERTLRAPDGGSIEAALVLLISNVSRKDYGLGVAMRCGVDKCTIRTLSIPDLPAPIRSAIRCLELPDTEAGRPISIREIQLDPKRRTVRKRDQVLHLTPKEFDLLHYLMARAGVPVRHAELLQKVWGVEYGDERHYLRIYIHELRLKIEDDPTRPQYLLTVPYFGYRFMESEDGLVGAEAA
jgi:two-component system KDP operon response regulator KdpE